MMNTEEQIEQQHTASHDQEHLARLAYSLWEARGCPADDPERDWFDAIAQIGSHPTNG